MDAIKLIEDLKKETTFQALDFTKSIQKFQQLANARFDSMQDSIERMYNLQKEPAAKKKCRRVCSVKQPTNKKVPSMPGLSTDLYCFNKLNKPSTTFCLETSNFKCWEYNLHTFFSIGARK